MKLLKTKFGDLYTINHGRNNIEVLDSEKNTLFYGCNKPFIKMMKKHIEQSNTIADWLKGFDDVCWDTNKSRLIAFVRDYVKYDMIHDCDIVFDKEWFDDNYNKIGNTYIMFEYSDCWKERGC